MASNGMRKRETGPLVAALAGGATIREAARTTGLSERTIARRLKEPAFVAAVRAARADMTERAASMLADAASDAVKTLRNLLRSDKENIQLYAAKAILELGTKVREFEELEARVRALEALSEGRT